MPLSRNYYIVEASYPRKQQECSRIKIIWSWSWFP